MTRGENMNSLHRDLKKLIDKEEKNRNEEQKWRLNFHIMPPVGWLNDPNGLCFFKGEYHFFFQYSPFDSKGGLKFWGHYKSKDMLHWKYMKTALFPDQPYDCHGVYSGSAYVENDMMYLYYTGNIKYEGNYNYITNGRASNTIYAECKDGVHIENKQCLLKNKDYPEEMTCHVRDPKVWKEKDNYYMVLGARTKGDIGEVLLYCSKDKKNWVLQNILKSKEKFGYMWECPDLFLLDDVRILSVSPQGVEAQEKKYLNVYQSGYYILEGDFKEKYKLSEFVEWDKGFDFYAPQTFEDNKGRRILVGWMGMPDCDEYYINPTVEYEWQHAFTMPRVLTIQDGKVFQSPIEEMQQMRKGKTDFSNKVTCESCFELLIKNIKKDCKIKIEQNVILEYNKNEKEFKLEFTGTIGAGRTKRNADLKECRNIRIFADASSLEIFLNDGEEVLTTRYYPPNETVEIVVDCENSKNTIWQIEKCNWKWGEEI